jgi:hypothetical protein
MRPLNKKQARAFEFLTSDDPHFAGRGSMRDRGAASGSNVGLTNQTTSDVYGTRSRSQVSALARVALDAGTDIKRLFRSEAAKQPSEKRSDSQRVFLLAGAEQAKAVARGQ